MYGHVNSSGYGWMVRGESTDGVTTGDPNETWMDKKWDWNGLTKDQAEEQLFWWKFWVINTECLREFKRAGLWDG